ncbi:uncharacterized protein LOC141812829 [Curcuma longa]|uniref:uncharacterized protein LOC141812829 n=1 Tax=Curcuma longa TaxID=136217 RepID=UPI003D9E8E4F
MDTAKKAWDYLENRFQATGGMHHYQLLSSLYALKHESGQSIDDFFSTIQSLWDRIDEANIDEEQLRVIQLLMKLGPEYESVRGSLLHRDPLPSLDIAMKEISFEATRFAMLRSPTTDSALAVPSSVPTFPRKDARKDARSDKSARCRRCPNADHAYTHCPNIECRYCHQKGHVRQNCPKLGRTSSTAGSSSSMAAVTNVLQSPQSTTPTLMDIHKLLTQVLSANPSLATTSGSGFADGPDSRDGAQDGSPV